MLPFVSLSCSAQPPPLIVPLSVSPPMLPVDVTGRSEETLPNEVCAVRLYPSPCGICTRMDENEVFNRMSRQPLVGTSDRKSTRLNSSHGYISYAVFCLKKTDNALKRCILTDFNNTRYLFLCGISFSNLLKILTDSTVNSFHRGITKSLCETCRAYCLSN